MNYILLSISQTLYLKDSHLPTYHLEFQSDEKIHDEARDLSILLASLQVLARLPHAAKLMVRALTRPVSSAPCLPVSRVPVSYLLLSLSWAVP